MTVVKLVKGLQSGTWDWVKAPRISPGIHFRSGAEIVRIVLLKSKDIESALYQLTLLAGSDACYEPRLASFFVGEM